MADHTTSPGHCEACGHDNAADRTACLYCGAPLRQVAGAARPADPATAIQPDLRPALPPAADVPGRCPACHAPFPADAVLCVRCGYHRGTGRRLIPGHPRGADLGGEPDDGGPEPGVHVSPLGYLVGILGSGFFAVVLLAAAVGPRSTLSPGGRAGAGAGAAACLLVLAYITLVGWRVWVGRSRRVDAAIAILKWPAAAVIGLAGVAALGFVVSVLVRRP